VGALNAGSGEHLVIDPRRGAIGSHEWRSECVYGNAHL
jgi:hypothetical protein